MKDFLLSCLMCCFIDTFVDWETGQCSFDSQQFRNCLEFVDKTPDTPEEYELTKECTTRNEIHDMMIARILQGKVMLEGRGYFRMYHQKEQNFYFAGQAIPVGYPVEDGSVGSYFEPMGIKLAMASTCQSKEAAWEYMRQTLFHKADRLLYKAIPVNRKGYNADVRDAKRQSYGIFIGDNYYPLEPLSQEECDQFNDFFNSITRCSLFLETDLLNIVSEEASGYFAGAWTLDQTVARIQNRASLYVNELR